MSQFEFVSFKLTLGAVSHTSFHTLPIKIPYTTNKFSLCFGILTVIESVFTIITQFKLWLVECFSNQNHLMNVQPWCWVTATHFLFEKAAKTTKKGIKGNWIEQHVPQAEPPPSSAAVMKHHFSVWASLNQSHLLRTHKPVKNLLLGVCLGWELYLKSCVHVCMYSK